LVEEAILAGLCVEVYTTDEHYAGFPEIVLVSELVMKKISEVFSPQGILAICKRPVLGPLSDKVLLLDQISDPGNMGTLLRSALGFGFSTVVADQCVDITNPKVLRSTQGALFHLNFIETSIMDFIRSHKEYIYLGTDLHGGIPLQTLKTVPQKTGLILGNEALGVRKEVLAETKVNLFIEIDTVESLNVGVAGSILMYYLK
jgi:TrmH family RNA methyltransferase